MIYKDKEISIEPLTKEIIDGSNYKKWFLNPEVTKYNSHGIFFNQDVDSFLKHANSQATITWAIMLDERKKSQEHFFGMGRVYYSEKHMHIGNIALQEIDLINRSAELAILIGETDHWKKGIGYQACKLVLQHGFLKLNLNRIWLGTLAENAGMINLAKKLKMQLEGVFAQAVWIDDHYTAINRYAILQEDWRKQ